MIGVSRGPSCGASRGVSLAHSSSPIPGSEGSPRVGLARGKSAGQASLYASLAHVVKVAGRRVGGGGGLPPGTGAVWFPQRGVSLYSLTDTNTQVKPEVMTFWQSLAN